MTRPRSSIWRLISIKMSESIAEEKNRGPIKTVEPADPPVGARREDARKFTRRSVESDKIRDAGISSTEIATNAVTKVKVADDAVGINELDTEIVTLAFGSGDTSKTATVTSGSIILGVYSSTVTSTPAYGELQLSISGTTLTGTRSASPGGTAAITYSVVLLKV